MFSGRSGDARCWALVGSAVIMAAPPAPAQAVRSFNIPRQDLAGALEAVSYTHLDVYKRQQLCRYQLSPFLSPGFEPFLHDSNPPFRLLTHRMWPTLAHRND